MFLRHPSVPFSTSSDTSISSSSSDRVSRSASSVRISRSSSLRLFFQPGLPDDHPLNQMHPVMQDVFIHFQTFQFILQVDFSCVLIDGNRFELPYRLEVIPFDASVSWLRSSSQRENCWLWIRSVRNRENRIAAPLDPMHDP